MGIILCIVGVLAGGAITFWLGHLFAKRSNKQMSKILEEHKSLLREALGYLSRLDPEAASKIGKELDQSEAEHKLAMPGSKRSDNVGKKGEVNDGDLCGSCKKGRFRWSCWAPGPFGAFTAWYRCNECGAELPNNEVFEG